MQDTHIFSQSNSHTSADTDTLVYILNQETLVEVRFCQYPLVVITSDVTQQIYNTGLFSHTGLNLFIVADLKQWQKATNQSGGCQ